MQSFRTQLIPLSATCILLPFPPNPILLKLPQCPQFKKMPKNHKLSRNPYINQNCLETNYYLSDLAYIIHNS